jgi:NAD(P)H-nitrite reductase large subunit
VSTVIVGHGMAAGRLLQELVLRGAQDLVVIGEEPHHAYNRLLLSDVLSAARRPDELVMRTPDWYERHAIAGRTDARVTGLDPIEHSLTTLAGEVICYDRLVLATGSRPNLPTLRGMVSRDGGLLPGVFAFRTLQDCDDIAGAVKPGLRAVVIGGGLLGVEAARGLSLLGLEVEVVHQGPHLMERQLDAGAGAVLRRSLQHLGVTTYVGARAIGVVEGDDGSVRGVRLADHHELICDLVVFACGIRPATAVAQAGGLEVAGGVVVDDHLATSAADVWAVGECAEHRGVVHGWAQAAFDQAVVLADVLCGGTSTYEGSHQVTRLRAADLELAAMGDTQAPAGVDTEVVCLSDPIAGTYRKTIVRGGRLVGALLLGDAATAGHLTRAFDHGTPLPEDRTALLLASTTNEGRVA